jgi:hypothetical protein
VAGWTGRKTILLLLGAAVSLSAASGCAGTRPPQPFEVPIESRLILRVPYFGSEAGAGAAEALTEVMTYHGLPTTLQKIILDFDEKSPSPHEVAFRARRTGIKCVHYRGDPKDLVAAVRSSHPLIVRLGAAAPPLAKGDYAVVVGYNPEGVVVNSRSVNQQIIAWSAFLTAWLKADNMTIRLEPYYTGCGVAPAHPIVPLPADIRARIMREKRPVPAPLIKPQPAVKR